MSKQVSSSNAREGVFLTRVFAACDQPLEILQVTQ